MKYSILVSIGLLMALNGGQASAEYARAGLFEEDTVLELSMEVDFDELCRPREDPDCDYTPSQLGYTDNGRTESIPVEIIVRGGWRAKTSNCRVPLLFIRFGQEAALGTPFEGQESLPLTTHCGRSSALDDVVSSRSYRNYEQYLLKEYLAYRLYNRMTDLSLRVRLARIRYETPGKPGKGISYYAFFTEHFDALAQRQELELLPRNRFDHEHLDLQQADLLALFQFMIGNTDWSIARQRNTILLQQPDQTQFPVPYDLDMSGLVNAPYAGPPPSLPLKFVTQRYYLGYCHPEADWDALFQRFLTNESVLREEPDTISGLFKKEKKSAKRYVDRFFRILHSPERKEELIINACQAWPPTQDDHMAPVNLGG